MSTPTPSTLASEGDTGEEEELDPRHLYTGTGIVVAVYQGGCQVLDKNTLIPLDKAENVDDLGLVQIGDWVQYTLDMVKRRLITASLAPRSCRKTSIVDGSVVVETYGAISQREEYIDKVWTVDFGWVSDPQELFRIEKRMQKDWIHLITVKLTKGGAHFFELVHIEGPADPYTEGAITALITLSPWRQDELRESRAAVQDAVNLSLQPVRFSKELSEKDMRCNCFALTIARDGSNGYILWCVKYGVLRRSQAPHPKIAEWNTVTCVYFHHKGMVLVKAMSPCAINENLPKCFVKRREGGGEDTVQVQLKAPKKDLMTGSIYDRNLGRIYFDLENKELMEKLVALEEEHEPAVATIAPPDERVIEVLAVPLLVYTERDGTRHYQHHRGTYLTDVEWHVINFTPYFYAKEDLIEMQKQNFLNSVADHWWL